MTAFAVAPAILRQQADHEFFVANWPQGLQRASQAERQLLSLMAHPCYRLTVAVDEQGIERLKVQPSPGMPSPLTPEAREYAREHRHELIAFVKQREATSKRLRESEGRVNG